MAMPVFAQQTLNATVPSGYRTQRVGAVQWTYPEEQKARLEAFQNTYALAWPRLEADLGVQLDDALDIRIARNPGQMKELAPTGFGVPGYASGVAYPKHGVILLTMVSPDAGLTEDTEAVLIHELSHVALYRAVQGQAIPLWFSEGLAIHQSGSFHWPRVQALLKAAVQHETIPLAELSRRFPKKNGGIDVAYAQSADLVNFLRGEDGDQARFITLITNLRKGAPFDQALSQSYGLSVLGLEYEWRQSLRTRYRILPLILGGSTVWALTSCLFVIAWWRRRKEIRRGFKRLAEEEKLELKAATLADNPAGEPLMKLGSAHLPSIEHDGESHTLH